MYMHSDCTPPAIIAAGAVITGSIGVGISTAVSGCTLDSIGWGIGGALAGALVVIPCIPMHVYKEYYDNNNSD